MSKFLEIGAGGSVGAELAALEGFRLPPVVEINDGHLGMQWQREAEDTMAMEAGLRGFDDHTAFCMEERSPLSCATCPLSNICELSLLA